MESINHLDNTKNVTLVSWKINNLKTTITLPNFINQHMFGILLYKENPSNDSEQLESGINQETMQVKPQDQKYIPKMYKILKTLINANSTKTFLQLFKPL